MKFNEYLKVINETAKKYNFNVEDYFAIDYNNNRIDFDANEIDYNEICDCLYKNGQEVENHNFYAVFELDDGKVVMGFES